MRKQRDTKQRKMVLEAVLSRCDHPTADQIYSDLRMKDDKISRGTVYRNLGILAEDGDITNVKVPAADRFDSRLDRHYHMYCTMCGKVLDAPLSYSIEYDEEVEKETGFRISRHRVVFEGLCQDCLQKQEGNT